jgi:hypothetical protein
MINNNALQTLYGAIIDSGRLPPRLLCEVGPQQIV